MVGGLGAGVLICCALVVLTWCSASYVQANPLRRLPGKLPDARQPDWYMSVGMLGIVLSVAGGLTAADGANALGWLLVAVVLSAGLLPCQLIHNRHLRK